MGQAHLCQPAPPSVCEGEASPRKDGQHVGSQPAWCGSDTTQVSGAGQQHWGGAGPSNHEDYESDASSWNSDGEEDSPGKNKTGRATGSVPPSRLVLARQRVFSPHLQLKFKSFYSIERQIGEGSYGSVFEALTVERSAPNGTSKYGIPSARHSTGRESLATSDLGIASESKSSPRELPRKVTGDTDPSTIAPSLASNGGTGGTPSTAVTATPGCASASCSQTPEGTIPSGSLRRVAVKCFRLSSKSGSKEEDKSPRSLERFHREVASRKTSFERERHILAQLEHPHIVRMFECFEERTALYIVMELCRGGELYMRIVQKARESRGVGGGFEEPPARMFFRQMLFATSYLHAHRIVHRDIKTENFLLLGAAGTPEGDMIKLCDFGTAVQLTNQQPRAMERIGTLSYTAPEIYAKEGADTIADAWSLGVVLYVLLVGASPFRTTGDEPREDTIRRIRAGDFDRTRPAWKNLSEGAMDLVNSFLVVREVNRLNSADALRHRWVEPRSVGPVVSAPVPPPEAGRRSPSPRRLLSPRCSRAGSLMNYAQYAPSVILLITRFVQLHAMQQLALLVCAQMLAEADLLNQQMTIPWYELFFALDADEDGRLSFGEFAAGLSHLMGSRSGLTKDQFFSLVKALDVDCSGSIDWIEWVAVALLSIPPEALDPEPLSTAFRLLDRPSGDGMIGAADILAVINTDAAGQCLSATHGRRRVLRLLSRWTHHSQDMNVGHAGHHAATPAQISPPPSLSLEDFRLLLQSTSGQPGPAGDEAYHLLYSRAIPGNAAAAPRALPLVSSFPWCQCQQPSTYAGTEEIVKAENVLVHQQSVVQSARIPAVGRTSLPLEPNALFM